MHDDRNYIKKMVKFNFFSRSVCWKMLRFLRNVWLLLNVSMLKIS